MRRGGPIDSILTTSAPGAQRDPGLLAGPHPHRGLRGAGSAGSRSRASSTINGPDRSRWATRSTSAWHLVLPVCTLGLTYMALYLRLMRGAMTETRSSAWVRAARARGLPSSRVVRRHIARPALLPVVTMLGLQAGAMLGGSVVIETVFAIPGLGSLAYLAVSNRDLPLIAGVVLAGTVLVIVVNLRRGPELLAPRPAGDRRAAASGPDDTRPVDREQERLDRRWLGSGCSWPWPCWRPCSRPATRSTSWRGRCSRPFTDPRFPLGTDQLGRDVWAELRPRRAGVAHRRARGGRRRHRHRHRRRDAGGLPGRPRRLVADARHGGVPDRPDVPARARAASARSGSSTLNVVAGHRHLVLARDRAAGARGGAVAAPARVRGRGAHGRACDPLADRVPGGAAGGAPAGRRPGRRHGRVPRSWSSRRSRSWAWATPTCQLGRDDRQRARGHPRRAVLVSSRASASRWRSSSVSLLGDALGGRLAPQRRS